MNHILQLSFFLLNLLKVLWLRPSCSSLVMNCSFFNNTFHFNQHCSNTLLHTVPYCSCDYTNKTFSVREGKNSSLKIPHEEPQRLQRLRGFRKPPRGRVLGSPSQQGAGFRRGTYPRVPKSVIYAFAQATWESCLGKLRILKWTNLRRVVVAMSALWSGAVLSLQTLSHSNIRMEQNFLGDGNRISTILF